MKNINILFLLILSSCTAKTDLLHDAIIRGDFKKIEELVVNKGIELNGAAYEEQPLLTSLKSENYDVFLFLLKNGADVKYNNSEVLEYIIFKNDKYALKLLLSNSEISLNTSIPSLGYSVFYWLSFQSDEDFILSIIDGSQNCNEVFHGKPVLQNILSNYSYEVFEKTLCQKIDFEVRNEDGLTILGIAILQNKIKAVDFLLENGALIDNVTLKDSWFFLGNHWSVGFENVLLNNEKAKLQDAKSSLLSGLILNQNIDGNYKLWIVKEFLLKGIDSGKPDKDGMLPIDYAAELGYQRTISGDESDSKNQKELRELGDKLIKVLEDPTH